MQMLQISHQDSALRQRPQAVWSGYLILVGISYLLSFCLPVKAAESYTLAQMMDIAVERNPAMNVANAQAAAALAGLITAKSYANPELEFWAGPSRYKVGNQDTKANWNVGLSQALEYGNVRSARRDLAESNIAIAEAGKLVTRVELRNRVKDAFYNVLQRQAILKLVEDDRQLLMQIRDRVKLRVDVGEAPKYEQIKADTELLAAERDYQTALVRINEAKAYLRGLSSNTLPTDYELTGELPMKETLPLISELKDRIAENPQLAQLRASTKSAEAKLQLEERLRYPGLTVKAGIEQDPDITSLRLGVAVPLPLWNKREGQIAEAKANINQTQAVLTEREWALSRDLESAYQRYLIAQQQVTAFEGGLLSQSEAVLKTAESAYRYGERGILEYLDAQRTYRIVRKDYISARYDYVSAMLEIERILGSNRLSDTQPQ
jgi:cobalt-zinc-cadmium efflux system outer membrane protein